MHQPKPATSIREKRSLSMRGRFGTFALAACAATLAFSGCSKKGGTVADKTPDITDPDNTTKPDVKTSLTAVDSLVKENKGKGLGVVTGFLTGEGKSIASGLLKQAANAAGERRLLTKETVPLKAATVLIFDALKPTTQADTTLKTDTAGNYTVVLPEGKYFGFAVYLDLETFSLVTTQIPNISPKADTVTKMDTAVAIEDVTSPSVTSVYDALAPNSDNVFLVGSIPSTKAKVNITFSEPMNRESSKGVILGKIDTANSEESLVLADTVKGVTMTWSGDSKELTLSVDALSENTQYGVIIPVSCKDLAKNPLEKQFAATFVTAKAEELAKVGFSVAAIIPANGESIKPIQNPGVAFNRPVDVFSIMKNAKISPEVIGFWEVAGSRATYVHKDPLKVGETYTVTLPTTIKDLSGAGLPKDTSFSFKVVDFEGAAKDKTGDDQAVALSVEQMFDAYVQGDLGRFGAYFHANFRMVEENKIFSRTSFLEERRLDIATKQMLSAGILAPVFDKSAAVCTDRISRWKVNPEGGEGDFIWAQSFVNPGQVPSFWDKDGKEIPKAELQFDGMTPRLTYKGKKYGFAPDFSQIRAVNQDNAKDDLRFMSEMMAKTSTLALEPVKVEMKEIFTVDGGLVVKGDTAKVAVKMTSTEKWSRTNFEGHRVCDSTAGETRYEILKFLLVREGSKWMVLGIELPQERLNADNFNQAVNVADMGGNQIQPVELIAPVNSKANAAIDGKVEFKWMGSSSDSVKGYIVGLAEDPRFCGNRPPYGALFFVKGNGKGKEVAFTLDANAQVVGTAGGSILRRAQDLGLPGWERVMFEFVLPKLEDATKGMAGVYNWKVIAVKDSAAAQFLANGFKFDRFLGESDFGKTRGYFSVKAMPQGAAVENFANQANVTQPAAVGFGDMDQDGYPDFIEQKYGTDMRNRNDFPDFGLDTDGDRIPDFLEKLLDKDGIKKLVDTKATDAERETQIAALRAMNIMLDDTDGDGFPNEIEQLLGFNPNDKFNNPGTRARAEAPIGVFKGLLATGDTKSNLSFRTYNDTTGKLWSAYTLVLGRDTLTDTVRASFNGLQNQLIFQIILPMDGPNAGRSFWMRGNYESFSQILMGPADIAPSVAKTSDMVNGGPLAGQWAASGRGEDVSGRLGGGTGPIGPANPMPTVSGITYRPPPSGTSETSSLEFTEDGGLILVNEFGDTLIAVDGLMVRRQPVGFAFQAQQKTQVGTTGSIFVDMGGQFELQSTGWVMSGHLFMRIDTGTVHKDIPGQISFKGTAGELDVTDDEPILVVGALKGWVQQDMSGTGLTGQNPMPVDTCRAGQVCQNNPPPTNSFGIPFIQGAKVFGERLREMGVTAGGTFYASANGQVMEVKFDSTGVSDAKAPWCNQVILKARIITPKEPTEADRVRYADMQKQLDEGRMLLVVLEEMAAPGKPVIIDKVLDPTGEVRFRVIGVEVRGTPPDYGTTTMACQPAGNPLPPPCPAGQTCTPTNPNPSIPGPIPGYSGTEDRIKQALVANGGIAVWYDSAKNEKRIEVDVATLGRDSVTRFVVAMTKMQPAMRVIFLNNAGNVLEPAFAGNNPVVAPPGMGTQPPPPCPEGQTCPTQPPPCPEGQTCPTQPPPNGTGPTLFSGDPAQIRTLLSTQGNVVTMMTGPNTPPVSAVVSASSVRLEGTMVLVNDIADEMKVYVVLGEPTDPRKPMMANGVIAVAPRTLLAGTP